MEKGLGSVVVFSFLVLALLSVFSNVAAFGGDGNSAFVYTDSTNPVVDNSCWNEKDDNDNSDVDLDDMGCVAPIEPNVDKDVLDHTEGNAWDTDLTTIMSEESGLAPTETLSIMFDGKVIRGQKNDNTLEKTDSTLFGSMLFERHLDEARPTRSDPDQNEWGLGFVRTSSRPQSSFPSNTVFKDNRVIYPPHNVNSGMCGDSVQNQDSVQPSPPFGNEPGPSSTAQCKSDYGEIFEKEYVVARMGGNPDPATCSCDTSTDEDDGHYASGDDVVYEREYCGSDGSCGSEDDPDPDYENEDDRSRYDCNNENSIYGGGDQGRNDPAATFTRYTAYEDAGESEVWCGFDETVTLDADGPKGNRDGWVVVENRNSDGDYATNEHRIIATESHEDKDNVGEITLRKNSGGLDSNKNNFNYWDEVSKFNYHPSCLTNDEGSTVCLIYADFHVEDTWSESDSGNIDYGEVIDYDDEYRFTPNESYSVCKNINRIAREHGDVDGDLVRCDYVKEDSGAPGDVKRVSPLPRPCGDQPWERFTSMEGLETDGDRLEEELAFMQECVQYEQLQNEFDAHEEPAEFDEEHQKCVLNGDVYPEGAVADISDYPKLRSEFSGFERGGDSADKAVCLDILGSNPSTTDDVQYRTRENGGEWWEMDNFRATEYIRNNKADIESSEWEAYWYNNPDDEAAEHTSITGVKDKYVDEKGIALEDDCKLYNSTQTIDCEDMGGGIGQEDPYYAVFTEGAMDDDFNQGNFWFDINLDNTHNRVQSGGGTGHQQSEPVSNRKFTVNENSEWDQGVYTETKSEDNSLQTSESSDSADKNHNLDGDLVYGKYVSETFNTNEEKFSSITIYNQFTPKGFSGHHPLVVEYANDPSFSTNVDSQKFYFEEGVEKETFDLSANPSQEYLRFKIGLSDSQGSIADVGFVIDDTGSMGGELSDITSSIKSFFENLAVGSRGGVITFKDSAQLDQPLTDSASTVKSAVGSVSAGGGGDCPEDASGGLRLARDSLSWSSENDVVILVIGAGVHNPAGIRNVADSLKSQGITAYTVSDGLSCGGYNAVANYLPDTTGGEHYNFGVNWDIILDDIKRNLETVPPGNFVNRVEVTAITPATDKSGNTQDDEPISLSNPGSSDYLEFYQDAQIDQEDDEWGYTPNLKWGIANNGSAWPPSACHGAPREQGINKKKEDAVYANSYIRSDQDVWSKGKSGGKKDGNWINPDNTTLSVREGGLTCDLTGEDWGYAVRTNSISNVDCLGGNCTSSGNPGSPGYEDVDKSFPHELVIPKEGLTFDTNSDPDGYDQNNLNQWPDACGDDKNEYLIREHAAPKDGEYNPVFTGRNNYYVCADRPTDCALDGKVYSEGQLADVGSVTTETGVQSEDHDICLDIDNNLPGGEWYDPDNEFIRDYIIGSGNYEFPERDVRKGPIDPSKPGKVYWQDISSPFSIRNSALYEARDSPYSPLGDTNFYNKNIDFWRGGYAVEDDCDSDVMQGCDDKGMSESRGTDEDPTSDLIYSHFRESKAGTAIKSDDYSTEGTWIVRMFVDGSSDHGSNTGQMNENTDGVNFDSTEWGPGSGWPTSNLNDSKIDPLEDTWAVASETYDAVGPTGAVYDTGQCYGRSPPSHSEGWVEKNETIMANSFAKREEVNSDGRDEGNWVDPDTTIRSASRGGTSCDLNSTDWGFGYDTGGGSLSVHQGDARDYGYEVDDRHVVSGDINFDMNSDPLGGNQDNLQQYPDACGDDKNEYLIREQRSSYAGGEIIPDLSKENIYVCADRITDCAYNGEVYSEGQTVDISSRLPSGSNPEQGDNIEDEEICLDLNKSTPGGEWYDKDQDFTVKNRIIGLQDTFDVSQGVNGYTNSYDIEGEVVDNSGGQLDINGRIINVGSDGEFSDTVQLEGGTTQRIDYEKGGSTMAQKRLVLPSSNAELDDLKISTSLMYDGVSVWNGVENFKDHDYDRDQYDPKYHGTDWRTQDDRYSRRELSYFNRTHKDVDEPEHYNPEGYATEDDCGPLLQNSGTGPCSDVGPGVQDSEWFSAGNFSIDGVSP